MRAERNSLRRRHRQRPLPRLANPFLPGANRRTPIDQRHYTLYIIFDQGFNPGPNTIYVDPAKNPSGVFTLRVYVPDKGRDITGGVGLPQVTWQPNSEGAPAFVSPCRELEAVDLDGHAALRATGRA